MGIKTSKPILRHQILCRVPLQLWRTEIEAGEPKEPVPSSLLKLGYTAAQIEGIVIKHSYYSPLTDSMTLLLEHPGYKEIAEFADAPAYRYDDEANIIPVRPKDGK